MGLSPGQRIGSYEIVSPIGSGGMGEVYRARDTKLNRDVAIKVLPEIFAGDPERLARFTREAQTLAALNHPNIATVYGVEGHALVMELLDGSTLRDELAHPIPTRKAIEWGVQIADGLAAAHEKGVIHRDVKPENLFVTRDGRLKILDFGIARAVETVPAATSTFLPNPAGGTAPGVVLGTVGYMSPEQVRGQAVDARSDIFSLGAVLYEMFGGRRPFSGDSAVETMNAILTVDPPPLDEGARTIPASLDRIVRRCLEKRPADRFHSARDVAFALDAVSGSNVSASGVAAAIAPRRRWRLGVVAALVIAAAFAAGVLLGRASRSAASPVTFETKTWDSEWITNARFAPDGRTIVFSAAQSGSVPRLFVIRPDTVTSQPFGPPAAHLLSVSSTGELAVLVNAVPAGHRVFTGTLARMTMDGAVRPWMEDVHDADWSPDGSTLAILRGGEQLEYPIGRVLYRVSSGYLSDIRVSPDGARVAFFEHQIVGDDRGWVKVVDTNSNVTTMAGEYWGEEGLAWSPDSHFVYFSASVRGGEEFQPLVVNVTGKTVAHQALASAGAMYVQDVSRDGRLLVMRDDMRSIVRVRVPGEAAERDFAWLDYEYRGFLSGDRKFLVFGDESQSAGANYAVALRPLDSSEVVRLGEGICLPLSPDGKWAPGLVPSKDQIVLYHTGAGDAVTLPKGPLSHYTYDLGWFPDSRRVLVCATESGRARCYTQDISNGTPVAVTPDKTTSALLAEDGRTVLMKTAGVYQVETIGSATPPTLAKGLTSDDVPFAWTSDSRSVVVEAGLTVPARIEKVDPATGQRAPLVTIAPPDLAGVTLVLPSQWIDDGRGYAYTYFRELSKLFVASGVRP